MDQRRPLVGGGGGDSTYGGTGDDYVVGSDGPGSVLDGGPGSDTIYGGSGNDYIVGGRMDDATGADLVVGGGGNDTMFGGPGDNAMLGGTGSDEFYPGRGNNVIWTDDIGTSAMDFIHLSIRDNINTIEDFTPGDGPNRNVLVFSHSTLRSFADVQANMTQVGVTTVISQSATDQTFLYNVQPFQLTANSFIFD
jgi:Ca2+-binding RTX toxin-like protein